MRLSKSIPIAASTLASLGYSSVLTEICPNYLPGTTADPTLEPYLENTLAPKVSHYDISTFCSMIDRGASAAEFRNFEKGIDIVSERANCLVGYCGDIPIADFTDTELTVLDKANELCNSGLMFPGDHGEVCYFISKTRANGVAATINTLDQYLKGTLVMMMEQRMKNRNINF